MRLEGIAVASCTVERLMRRLSLRGARRGKVVRTTTRNANAPCQRKRVNRQFKAEVAQSVLGVGLHVRFNLARLAIRAFRN